MYRSLLSRCALAAVTSLVLALGTLISLAVPASAAGALDQSNVVDSGGGANVIASQRLAQIFTAGRSGAMDRVAVEVIDLGYQTDTMVLEVVTLTANGAPVDGAPLATATIQQSDVSPTGAWTMVEVPLDQPVVVRRGTQYAITLTSDATDWGTFAWESGNESYARGYQYYAQSPDGGWSTRFDLADFGFQTFVDDVDTDADGVLDDADNCPDTPNPAQTDSDADALGDVCDATPNGDTDGDGVDNASDNCPMMSNAGQADTDGDGTGDGCDSSNVDGPLGDLDSDGVTNADDADDTDGPSGDPDADGALNNVDNCPDDSNATQADADGDDLGDACDPDNDDGPTGDLDGDGIDNATDPDDTDGVEGDTDDDGVTNGSDNCPSDANSGQTDADGDELGDVCDPDDTDGPDGDVDGDGTDNATDTDSSDGPLADQDGDGVANGTDNCSLVMNSAQSDADDDGTGDGCEASHARSLTLGDAHRRAGGGRQLELSGALTVADTTVSCAADRKVLLARYDARSRSWSRVATALTDADGSYVARVTDRTGTYRARVKRHATVAEGFSSVCSSADVSDRHRH